VIEIMRSTWAMALAVVAGLLFAVGKLLQVVAFAIVSGPNRLDAFNDLNTAGAWLAAVAGAVAVAAITSAVGSAAVRRRWREIWEVVAAALATFVIAVGLLVDAATSPGGSLGANIVAAVGFGGWVLLLTVKAAQRSLEERLRTEPRREAPLWLAAAVGTLFVAVASGLPNASAEDKGLALTTALLWMVGLAVVALATPVDRLAPVSRTSGRPVDPRGRLRCRGDRRRRRVQPPAVAHRRPRGGGARRVVPGRSVHGSRLRGLGPASRPVAVRERPAPLRGDGRLAVRASAAGRCPLLPTVRRAGVPGFGDRDRSSGPGCGGADDRRADLTIEALGGGDEPPPWLATE
jgi:hypothetical protein